MRIPPVLDLSESSSASLKPPIANDRPWDSPFGRLGVVFPLCSGGLFKGLVGSIVLLLLYAADGVGQSVPRRVHPWGQFEVGAWKVLRATTESFENGRQTTSLTETRFTLEAMDASGPAIRFEVQVEMAGKRFRTEPQIVKQGWHGEPLGDTVTVRELGPDTVTVEGRAVNCQLFEVETTRAENRSVTRIWYSPSVAPYVFKRESLVTESVSGRTVEETTLEVTVLEVPCRVGRQVLSASQLRGMQKFSRGTVVTLSLVSPEIPGGVICQSSREMDRDGTIVRRTTMELVDFGLQPTLRHPGGLRWHLLPRRILVLPKDWIQPGLLPELQGLSWSSDEATP